MNASIFKKICLLGDFAVGKTSLVRRFLDNQFNDEYLSTIGVKISRKLLEVPTPDNQLRSLNLVLWDLEGKDDFRGVAPSYLRGASGAIIVGDVTRPQTLTTLQNHVTHFLSHNPAGRIVIACNKMDMIDDDSVLQELDRPRQAISLVGTSAKSGTGVDEVFRTLCLKLAE
ncbi:MAG: GTP-binding protein [Ignavibacteriae bacterium]|nr:GTP-binding protein [Ignavibacteriota bacterium]